uniref:Uncharacterized protein n=1 Tax=Rhizophagus irregularis (strain DAOM 181602 / DAOM 197198 / MUCL 43194) TaxID=747089 RepID=U9TWC5_RHIID
MNLSRQYILVVLVFPTRPKSKLERFEEFRQDYSPKPRTAGKQRARFETLTNPVSDAICETPSTSSTIKTQTNDQSTPTDTPLVFTGKATDYYTSDGEYAQRNLDNVLIDDKGLKNHASFYLIKILRLLRITTFIPVDGKVYSTDRNNNRTLLDKGSKEWYAELTRRESSNINKVQQTNSLGTSVKKLDQERINVSRDSNEHHVYLLTSYFTKRKKATTDSDKLKELNSQYEEFQLAHPILFNTKDAQNNDASTSL